MSDYSRDRGGRRGAVEEDVPELHISNLHPKTTARELEEDVSRIAVPTRVHVPADPTRPGYNRGFGFCAFRTMEDMERVLRELQMVDGKVVNITIAKTKPSERRQSHYPSESHYAPPHAHHEHYAPHAHSHGHSAHPSDVRRGAGHDYYPHGGRERERSHPEAHERHHYDRERERDYEHHRDRERVHERDHERDTRTRRRDDADFKAGSDRDRERDRERDRDRDRERDRERAREYNRERDRASPARSERAEADDDRTPVKEDLSDFEIHVEAVDDNARERRDDDLEGRHVERIVTVRRSQAESEQESHEDRQAAPHHEHDDESERDGDAREAEGDHVDKHDVHVDSDAVSHEEKERRSNSQESEETAYVLHVSNLHPKTTSRDLEDDVRKLVTPRTVRVIMDLETQLSRGFGFIYLNSEEDMRKVMEELKTVDGKHVKVQQAKRTTEREKTPGVFLGKKLAPLLRTRSSSYGHPYPAPRSVDAPLRSAAPPRSRFSPPPHAPPRFEYAPAPPPVRSSSRERSATRDTYIPSAPVRRPVFTYDDPHPPPRASSRDSYHPPSTSRDTYVPPMRDTYVPPSRDTYVPRR